MMYGQKTRALDYTAGALEAFFLIDRLLKLWAVVRFFRHAPAAPPARWPTVTLIQPITRGSSHLRENLRMRARLEYPELVQHVMVCDECDAAAQEACRELFAEERAVQGKVVLVSAEGVPGMAVASKTAKLQAALPSATGEVLCFVDDDIGLRPQTLRLLVRDLMRPGVGATFGLACYRSWETIWSSLMSLFVNANALPTYIPATFLTEPFTITGHCFALRRETLAAVGEFAAMEARIDDDHDLAQRLRQRGLRLVQTPMIYDVWNDLGSWRAYAVQMKRWFVFPRQALLPCLTPRDRSVTLLGSLGNLVPPLLAMLGIASGRMSAWRALGISLTLSGGIQLLCEVAYLRRRTPALRWLLLPVVQVFAPVHIVHALISNSEIEWRGQRMRIKPGGSFEVVR
jgi:ceramide glucosyltransferase